METQTEAREKLYEHVSSPGEDIPCNIERPPLRDDPPDDQEIRRGVIKSHLHRSTGGSEMRAEDMKYWLRGIEREEKAEEDGEEGYAGAGDTWRMLVKLIRHIWKTGEIPQQMLWTIIVLINSEGEYGRFQGHRTFGSDLEGHRAGA